MRIVFLSDTETQGGAGKAASRLADGLSALGHEIIRIVLFPDPDISGSWKRLVLRPAGVAEVGWDETPNRSAEPLVLDELDKMLADLAPDVINIHNLHGGIKAGWSAAMAGVCADHAPTAWTLHDMWSFTGRCAYSGDCRAFVAECGSDCPTASEYPSLRPQALGEAFRSKARVLNRKPLTAICPSVWLAGLARRGLWRRRRIEVIANGLDLSRYRPMDRREARRMLGLKEDGMIVLLAAANLADPRKGFNRAVKALSLLGSAKPAFITIGRNDGSDLANDACCVHLGFLEGRDKIAAYCAADVYVHAAVEDNLPNTVMEALACGTPVAGFARGGVVEMVDPAMTGQLAGLTAEDLAQAISATLTLARENPHVRRMCREAAEKRFDLLTQAKRYARLFEELAERSAQ